MGTGWDHIPHAQIRRCAKVRSAENSKNQPHRRVRAFGGRQVMKRHDLIMLENRFFLRPQRLPDHNIAVCNKLPGWFRKGLNHLQVPGLDLVYILNHLDVVRRIVSSQTHRVMPSPCNARHHLWSPQNGKAVFAFCRIQESVDHGITNCANDGTRVNSPSCARHRSHQFANKDDDNNNSNSNPNPALGQQPGVELV